MIGAQPGITYLQESLAWLTLHDINSPPDDRLVFFSPDPLPGWLFLHMSCHEHFANGVLIEGVVHIRTCGPTWSDSIRDLSTSSFPAASVSELTQWIEERGMIAVFDPANGRWHLGRPMEQFWPKLQLLLDSTVKSASQAYLTIPEAVQAPCTTPVVDTATL
jgi:hypothetical protein